MARVVWEDVALGAAVGLVHRFGTRVAGQLGLPGDIAQKVITYGVPLAGIGMTMADWNPEMGRKLTLAGTPRATEAIIGLVAGRSLAEYAGARAARGSAPIPAEPEVRVI